MQDIIAHLKRVLPPIESLTTLKQLSTNSKELHGGCPNPACDCDTDGFWMKDGKGYCRGCTPQGGDIIDWHLKINGMTHFSELLVLYPMETRGAGDVRHDEERFQHHVEKMVHHNGEQKPNNINIAARWHYIRKNTETEALFPLLVDRRKLSREIVINTFNDGKIRFSQHHGKDSMAVPFSPLQGDINGPSVQIFALQFITIDGEPFPPFTIDPGTGKGKNKGKNKVFMKGSMHDDGFFQAGTPFEDVLKDHGTVAIVEGVIDALTGAQVMPEICWLATGSTSYTKKINHLKQYLNSLERIIIFQDNDKPATDFVHKVSSILNAPGKIHFVTWSEVDPKGYDINDLLKTGQEERIRVMIKEAMPVPVDAVNEGWEKKESGSSSTTEELPEIFWNRELDEPNPYPIEAFPEIAREAILEYMPYGKQPEALVGSSCLMTMNLVCQGLGDVARDSTLLGPISLIMILIGNSGERKSTVDKHFSGCIRKWLEQKQEEMRPLISERNAEIESWKSKWAGVLESIKNTAKKGGDTSGLEQQCKEFKRQEPKELKQIKMFYGDTNPASLGESLTNGYPVSALWSDEAGAVIGGDGMKAKTQMLFLSMLNSLWDSGKFWNDRKTTSSTDIPGCRFCNCLLMQEAVFDELQKGGLTQSIGYFSRALIASPVSTIGLREYQPPPEWKALHSFNNRILSLLSSELPVNENGCLSPPVIPLSPEGFELWKSFYNETEKQMGPLQPFFDVKDYVNKIAENAARIAATFHTFMGDSGGISGETMHNANKIAFWYFEEALRIFGTLPLSDEESDGKLLLAWLFDSDSSRQKGFNCNSFQKAELLRYGPYRLRHRKKRDAALKVLSDNKWLKDKNGIINWHPLAKQAWEKAREDSSDLS